MLYVKNNNGPSLVAQWQSPPGNAGDTDLIPDQEDPTSYGATKPMD